MENKKTSELLDLLWELENAPEGKEDWDKYAEVYDEVIKRPPFNNLLGDNKFNSDAWGDMTLEERTAQLSGEIKLLNRHKHDSHTGDVMVRI